MKKNLDFTYVTSGLEVSFRVLTKVPAMLYHQINIMMNYGMRD